jgi:hypothetical protein
MQINRAALIRIAKETAEKAALSDPNLVAAYLTGSLRTSDPFIGNATDVDIVFVHPGEPKIRREIIPLTPENQKNCASTPGWGRNCTTHCRCLSPGTFSNSCRPG